MRALFVRLMALGAAGAAAASLAAGPPVAIHAGDSITDRQVFAYLSFPAHPGDWVRYRVTFAGRSTVIKTIGFGSEKVSGASTLFIETHVRALAVTGLPAESTTGIGDDAVLKTYLQGSSFSDLAHTYRIVTSALKVGAFESEVASATGATYSALTGAVDTATRTGRVQSVNPEDVTLGRVTLHATHVVANFPAVPLAVGGTDAGYTLEVWQSPDMPFGTVAISSAGSRAVRWRLMAFGNGYRTLFTKTLDQIRAGSSPQMQ
jgi:hypothetical protein